MTGKRIRASALNLFLRMILIAMLSFMAIPVMAFVEKESAFAYILFVVFGILYLFMLCYFFVFTLWSEGGSDRNRVANNVIVYHPWKGFLSAAIVMIPLYVIQIIPLFFSDTTPEILKAVLTVLKLIFSMPGFFPTLALTGGDLSQFLDVMGTSICCVLYTIAIVCSGIGYLVGYKQITLIRPWIEKLTK